jgi:hypothetical protein
VTLDDVTPADASLAATPASSPPTPCTRSTSFALDRSVGHAFVSQIDGYDRDDIVPAAPGSREMRDAATGAPVCPTWRATCGDAPDTDGGNPLRKATVIVELTETFVTGCTPLARVASTDCATDHDSGANDGSPPELDEPDGAAFDGDTASSDGSTTSDGSFDAVTPASDALDASQGNFSDAAAQVLDDRTREGG